MSTIDQVAEHLTTRRIQEKESRMSRTREVKRRLGPIMERMKTSLDTIQKLEEKLNLGASQAENQRPKPRYPVKKSGDDKNDEETEKEEGYRALVTGTNNSRSLLKKSMEMLKKKLYRLQHMEDLLHTSEDRRQNLQHQFLQASLSKPMLELAAAKRKNQELERQVAILEKDCSLLEEKCKTVDELQMKIISLNGQVQDYHEMEAKLREVNAQNEMYVLDLEQRQSRLNQQAVKCDDLECQVEQLTTMCDNLLKSLKKEEERAEGLERQLLAKETSHLNKGANSSPPRTIHAKGSADSGSTALTEADTDVSTLESISNENNASHAEDTLGNDDEGSEGMASVVHEGAVSAVREMSADLPDDVDSPHSRGVEDGCSSILPGDSEDAVIRKLMTKLDNLSEENALLRKSKREAQQSFRGLLTENAKQSARIQELEEQLRGEASTKTSASSSPERPERTSFFKKLLKSDSPRRKIGSADKARQISAELAGLSGVRQVAV